MSRDQQQQHSGADETVRTEAFSKLTKLLQEAQRRKLSFLLLGRTGVGKSSTVNSLMGQEVAPVGDFAPETVSVEHYDCELEGVKFAVIDTPGLCDDLPQKGKDYDYLRTIHDHVDQFDSLWFVTRLDETRVTSDEQRGIQLITEAFGAEAWNRGLIVFTFADNIAPDRFQYQIDGRSKVIRAEIAKRAGEAIAAEIPAVAVTNRSRTTPDGMEWVSELFTQVIVRIRNKKALPFLMALAPRIKNPVSEQIMASSGWPSQPAPAAYQFTLNDRQQEQVRETLRSEISADIIVAMTGTGATVGAFAGAVAGPVGAAVGAAVGGLVGLAAGTIAWLTRRR